MPCSGYGYTHPFFGAVIISEAPIVDIGVLPPVNSKVVIQTDPTCEILSVGGQQTTVWTRVAYSVRINQGGGTCGPCARLGSRIRIRHIRVMASCHQYIARAF